MTRKKSRNEEHPGCSITNLPSDIVADIFLRLQIKEIIFCKCTCKSWYATISNPEFAKLHYAQSEVFPFARIVYFKHVSRILYPLELEQVERFMDRFPSQCEYYSRRNRLVKLDSKLKIPVRNFPLVSINGDEDIALKAKSHCYKVVNSCTGFLCLSDPFRNNPVVVCNPVTGEFINLPQVIKGKNFKGFKYYFDCGFGFSPKTNQYKVVKMFEQYSSPEHVNITTNNGKFAEVHILGTKSWRKIEFSPYSGYMFSFPTYLNGAIHWICFVGKEFIPMKRMFCTIFITSIKAQH